jgi:hypothetical protein
MCELLNLEVEKKNYLSILEEGQGIIRVNSVKDPFLLWVPYIERESLHASEIRSKNEQILRNTQSMDSSFNNYEKKKLLRRSSHYFRNFLKKIRDKPGIKNKKIIDPKLEFKDDVKILVKNDKINKKREILADPLAKEIQGDEEKRINRPILHYKNLLLRYRQITNLYKTGAYDEMVINSIELVNLILDKISQQIGIKFTDINNFLEVITEMKLKNKFILYDDIKLLTSLLDNRIEANHLFKPEILASFFSIIQKIMEKLKVHCKVNKENKFSTAYDDFKTNSIKINKNPFNIKILKNGTDEYKLSLKTSTDLDDFGRLESFIDELFKSQKENK